ncbi:MAG: IS21 family transposase [Caldimonas sp.]
MTKPPEVEAEIRRLYFAEHWRVGTIASQLGVHADVVRRALGLLPPPDSAVVRQRTTLIAPYLPFIEDTLRQYPRLRATRVFDMARERGYPGCLRTLRYYVASMRPSAPATAYLRTDPLPGEQAQIDWAHVGDLPVTGGRRALWAFVMVLSHSRALWAELVLDLTVHSLCRSLVRALSYFGGTPRQWLFDNPKIVVLERHGAAVRFHPTLLDLCGKCRVQPRLCTVRQPQEKGRVERSIRYLRDRFFAGRTIGSLEQGNRDLLRFIEEIALPRPHPRQIPRTVADVFAEERLRLLAPPEPLPATDLVTPVPADKTAFIRFDTNDYSVPHTYAERSLTLAADDVTVRLLDGQDEVARHPRCYGRKQQIEAPEHRAALLAERRGARDLKGRDRLRALLPGVDVLITRWLDSGRFVGVLVTRTIKLLDLYGEAILAPVVADAALRGLWDPGALAVACEQRRRQQALPVPLPFALPGHIPDRDVIPHDLETYDAKRR